jgi:chemotaxis protein MotB
LEEKVRNITIIVLSVVLAAAIISGLILYQRHLDTKASLLISKKSLSELNEKVAQLNQETSALHNQIRTNAKQLMELKSAQESIATLENTIKLKDQRLSQFKEKINTLERDLEEERRAKDAILTDLQERLQGSQSHIRYLEEEVAKGHNEIQELQGQFINLKGQKALAETKKGQLKSTYEALITDLKKQIENQEITIKAFKNQISVTLVDRILFEFGKATITSEGEKILQKVGEILKNIQGKQIRIVGHTDNIPIMSKYQYKFPTNWELSGARSSAVIRYFQKNIHLDPRNLEAVGRSFYEPIASNETSQGRAQNRRVEIIISPQLE